MENKTFTKEEVISLLDDLLQCPDILMDAVQNENTNYDAEELFNISQKIKIK